MTTEDARLREVLQPLAVFFDHRGREVKGGFTAFSGFFLTTEDARLREVLPPSAGFFDHRRREVKGGFTAFGGFF